MLKIGKTGIFWNLLIIHLHHISVTVKNGGDETRSGYVQYVPVIFSLFGTCKYLYSHSPFLFSLFGMCTYLYGLNRPPRYVHIPRSVLSRAGMF